MNKEEVVSAVAAYAGIPKVTADSAVTGFLNAVRSALMDGEAVQLNNFGTFAVQKRNARIGRNPHTGEAVPIPARYAVKFTPSGEMRSKVERYIK